MRVDGVDISHWQDGELNLAAAKRAGVKFVYHKATDGKAVIDENYSERRMQAKAAGLPFGAYHFAQPAKGTALAEAKHFIATAKPVAGDLRPALDLERNEHALSRADLTTWVKTFVGYVLKQTGVVPVIYTSYDLDDNFGALLWQPRYNNMNTPPVPAKPWTRVDIWQFSNGVYGVPNEVTGIGHADLDHMRDDLTIDDLLIPGAPTTKEPVVATTAEKIIKIIRAEVGYRESFENGHWTNHEKYAKELPGFDWVSDQGQPWCATFVSWAFWKAGVYDLLKTPSASCDVLASGFKKDGRWSEYPAIGAVVFYGKPSDLNHTGIVVAFDADTITTVEGNTNEDGGREGSGVFLKHRNRRDANVIGYGYPRYAEGIESADPKFADKAKPEPKPTKDPGTKAPQASVMVSLAAVQAAGKVPAWRHALKPGTVADVQVIRAALKAENVRDYRAWQKQQGVTPTSGIPDAVSLRALGKRNGFKVVK